MLVTVIIPSYNHQHYVGKAIHTVLDQTWPDIDLIVIDDGSSDGSKAVIGQIHQERGGFRFVDQIENRGLISSLNKGLEMAKGEFFCELASDDFLPSDSIEKRARFLINHPDHVALFADAFRVFADTVTDTLLLDEKRRNLFNQFDPLRQMLKGVLPVFATGMFRTDIVRKIGGFDPMYKCYEDLEMPVFLCMAGKVACLDDSVLFRREHATNTSSITATIRTDKILCYEKLLTKSDFYPYTSLLRYQLRRSYLALGRHLSKTGGGTEYERKIFQKGWPFAKKDIRLLFYLLKWAKN